MSDKKGILIVNNSSVMGEYIIKDKNNITIGRFNIIFMDCENKRCDVKFKFYRINDQEILLETLKVILNGIFKDEKIHKINIYAPENINFEPLLNLGFILEGIISDGIIVQGEYCSEILMGISRENYIKGKRVQLLEIKTKRLVLRILTNEDAQQVLEYYIRNKGHLEMYEPLRNEKFYTLKMQRNIIREGYRQFLKGTAMEFGVFKDKKLIGILKVSDRKSTRLNSSH